MVLKSVIETEWAYLYAGMISAGLPNLKLYRPNTVEYLTRLVEAKQICDHIDLELIDANLLAQYMGKDQLALDIQEVYHLYEQATLEHRDLLIQLRLNK